MMWSLKYLFVRTEIGGVYFSVLTANLNSCLSRSDYVIVYGLYFRSWRDKVAIDSFFFHFMFLFLVAYCRVLFDFLLRVRLMVRF